MKMPKCEEVQRRSVEYYLRHSAAQRYGGFENGSRHERLLQP